MFTCSGIIETIWIDDHITPEHDFLGKNNVPSLGREANKERERGMIGLEGKRKK